MTHQSARSGCESLTRFYGAVLRLILEEDHNPSTSLKTRLSMRRPVGAGSYQVGLPATVAAIAQRGKVRTHQSERLR